MGSSSGSAWQRSFNSREFNTSRESDRDTGIRSSFFVSEIRKEFDRVLASNKRKNLAGISGVSEGEVGSDLFVRPIEWEDISLRQWLDKPERVADEFECLHIFRQILEIVQVAHSQGIAVQNVRPSCFVMSSFNHVSYIESASCSSSGSDSIEDCSTSQSPNAKNSASSSRHEVYQDRSTHWSEGIRGSCTVSMGLTASSYMQFDSSNAMNLPLKEEERKHVFPMKQVLNMEAIWYTSPEELEGFPSSCASDIYKLGVVLFELFCSFGSREDKERNMSSLKHRILPPQLLQKWPKEASFCLLLSHPDPGCRPKLGELLQSNFLNDPRDNLEERQAATQLKQSVEEEELLLEFLLWIQKRKQEAVDKLQSTVSLLSSDIREVSRHQNSIIDKECKRRKNDHLINDAEIDYSDQLGSRKRFRFGFQTYHPNLNHSLKLDTNEEVAGSSLLKNSRLMKNLKKLESAYFMTRSKPLRRSNKLVSIHSGMTSNGKSSAGPERSSANSIPSIDQQSENRIGWIDPFLAGLCKYLSYNKLKVKANLKQGDLLNSANIVCSIGFDRDGEFFASAGINKKIKVFECDLVMNGDRDIHYPVVEMASSSKLTCICWNKYIKSQIASSNFDGVVQLWDVSRNQVCKEMREHNRRVWSVDFSSPDPAMLASGSDDCSVKLWNVNQEASVETIKTKANVCSVQFSTEASHFLAFGSADHKVYYYDLRSTKFPWCTFVAHRKTVSSVKFLSSSNIISSSTDNTIRLWDISTSPDRIVDSAVQTFTGHTNVKNFVGLSVSAGYIATGSETNEVFVYHKGFPMHSLSFKFDSTAPTYGCDMDDSSPFISSLCWRGQSSMLVAANSTGNIKILEMV